MGCNCTTSCPDYKRIQFRRDTAANWTSRNPPLAEGEFGYETDTGKAKIGTGKHYWKDLPYWPEVGDGGDSDSCAHIVSEVEPPPGTEIGDLWIDPTADTQAATIDVLAEIRGKVIAPKAIDLDGPNTLYIAQDADGSVKLSLRSDAKGSRLDNFFATEDWVLANSGNIYVGTTAPGNLSTLWLNPAGGGIAPTVEPPFVVSDLAPTTTSSIWINPKG